MSDINDVIASVTDSLQAYDAEQKAADQTQTEQIANLQAELAQTQADLASALARIDELENPTEPPPPPPPPPPAEATLKGTTFNEPVGPSKFGSQRAYDYGDDSTIQKAIARGVTHLDLSSRDDTKSGSVVVGRIKSLFAKYPQLTSIDYFHSNEADRTDHDGANATTMAAWAGACKTISDAIYAEKNWPAGKTVMFGVDMTGYGTVLGNSQKMMTLLKNNGTRVDVYGSSMYPPGRNKKPPTVSSFDDFIRPSIDVAAQFNIPYVSCLEIGTPLSSLYDRPSYVATWYPEFVRYAKSKGRKPRTFDYWNGNKAADAADNRFSADGSTATVAGKTEKAFVNS